MCRIRYIVIVAVLMLTAGACKLGKKYVRPELNLPETLGNDGHDTLSVSAISWDSLYQDTVLQGLIRQTLENNKDVKIAAARLKELSENRKMSKADLFPKINARLFYDREYDESPDFAYEAKLEASWEVDLWGRLRWTDQAALSDYLASVEGQRALRLSLVAEVAQAYFELIALDQELAIVKQTLQARQEGVRIAKLRFEGGLTSETSFKQAQLELARTRTLPPDLEKQIRVTTELLEQLGAGSVPTVTIFNKCDACGNLFVLPFGRNTVRISARTGEGLPRLLQEIARVLPGRVQVMRLRIPYADAGETARLRRLGKVENERFEPDGIALTATLDSKYAPQFQKYMITEP